VRVRTAPRYHVGPKLAFVTAGAGAFGPKEVYSGSMSVKFTKRGRLSRSPEAR
jgi:hypothetical protein